MKTSHEERQLEHRVAEVARRLSHTPNLATWNEARRLYVKASRSAQNAPDVLEMMRVASAVNDLARAMRANHRGVAASLSALWHASETAARLSRRPLGRRSARAHRPARRVASTANGGASDDGGSGSTEPPPVGASSGAETLAQLALSTLALAVRARVAGVL